MQRAALLRQDDAWRPTTRVVAFPSEMIVDGDRDFAELGGLAFPIIPPGHCHNCKGQNACEDEEQSIHDGLGYEEFAKRGHGASGDVGRDIF